MKDGTRQKDRMTLALEAGYIAVDEMRFEDLLSMSADFSRLLTFYNLQDKADGDWSPFFASNEAVMFSVIQTLDLKKAETAFNTLMQETVWRTGSVRGRNIFLSQREMWKGIANYRLAKKIDTWYVQLKQAESESGRTLRQQIRLEIETHLGNALSLLKIFLAQYGEGVSLRFQQDFHRDWRLADAAPIPVPAPSETPTAIEAFLKTNFYTFYNAILSLKKASNRLLPLSLKSKKHPPSIGLYIAFFQLFQRAQQQLNRFPKKHLDFYYTDVLKVQARKRVPDSTYLIFHPTTEDKSVFIGAGTLFSAGRDDRHQDIVYASENDLWVDRAEIVSLRTLYFARNPYSSPENCVHYVTAAKGNEIPILESKESARGMDAGKNRKSWPLFGAPKGHASERLQEDAAFGFCVASPVLFLKEGERVITLSLNLAQSVSESEGASNAGKNLNDVLVALLLKMKADSGDAEPPNDGEKQAFFFKVFRQMFRVDLTTETGWLEVDDALFLCHLLDKNCEKDLLKIRMRLSPEADAIVAYAPEVHGPGYASPHPLLRLTINPKSYLFPYSLLVSFIVKEVRIEVAVTGARQVLVYNQLGRLDPNSPFKPFGPLPAVGSYCILGNPEMARKRITAFDLDIEWGDLPREKGGFESYYRDYPTPYDNAAFKARITILNGGRWLPLEEAAQVKTDLFQSERCGPHKRVGEGIDKNRRISFDAVVDFFKAIGGDESMQAFRYAPELKGGFFKLTLAAPETGFGHKDYPTLLTQVLTANARMKLPKLFKPAPNTPYTPLINSLSINYKAAATLNLMRSEAAKEKAGAEQFFHIHPFGYENLTSESYRHIHLLPRYTSEGSLFIGLSEAPLSGTLTLFFHLREDATPETGTAPSVFVWSYLASNRWHVLDRFQVVSDTTSGFLTSGIVTLKIPEAINRQNTIMPGGPFWIRVSVAKNPERLCSVYAIHTQAVKVTWQASSFHLKEKLRAGTIKSSIKSIPGIGEIKQIVEAFGGRPMEASHHLKQRISERLKHKNRATTPWDYERLILEKFPEIFKVKCFPNRVSASDPAKQIRPGHLLIVVIPHRLGTALETAYPMVNGAVLKAVQSFVKTLASPFATLAVRNPAYEQIQIRCTVKLKKNEHIGHHVEMLNREISDYLSPWSETGYRAGFGWCIRRYDLESFIRNRSYVEWVTNFSMLHITNKGEGYYDLCDSVAAQGREDSPEEIHPYFPWSLPMPMKRHFIETTDKVETIAPEVTGIDELEVGNTFIITKR